MDHVKTSYHLQQNPWGNDKSCVGVWVCFKHSGSPLPHVRARELWKTCLEITEEVCIIHWHLIQLGLEKNLTQKYKDDWKDHVGINSSPPSFSLLYIMFLFCLSVRLSVSVSMCSAGCCWQILSINPSGKVLSFCGHRLISVCSSFAMYRFVWVSLDSGFITCRLISFTCSVGVTYTLLSRLGFMK